LAERANRKLMKSASTCPIVVCKDKHLHFTYDNYQKSKTVIFFGENIYKEAINIANKSSITGDFPISRPVQHTI
jgi:hypothetical protein